MTRIIIDSELDDDFLTISLVRDVIRQGKISGDDDTYCYATVVWSKYVILASKLKSGTHKFRVTLDK